MPEEPNTFVEFHVLTSHVPANLNRDELGTPKTAIFGGERRLRISSQCLKRTWRMSEFFRGALAEADLGLRTKYLPEMVLEKLKETLEQDKKKAIEEGKKSPDDLSPEFCDGLVALLTSIGKKNAKANDEDDEDDEPEADAQADAAEADTPEARTAHLLFLSRQEIDAVTAFVRDRSEQISQVFEKGKKGAKKVSPDKVNKLRSDLEAHIEQSCTRNAVDVSLFGRFVTGGKITEIKTVDAAMQVAHAIGTQAVKVEYDYFSAVDDQQPKGETGAGHIGETEFGAAVFYKYAVCDMNQLVANLADDRALAAASMKAIAKAVARSVPTGKKNSTAPQNPADYLAVVVRRDAPVSLANAFLKPVTPDGNSDVMDVSITRLQAQAERYAEAYGDPELVPVRFVLNLRDQKTPDGWTTCKSLSELSERVEALLKGEGGA